MKLTKQEHAYVIRIAKKLKGLKLLGNNCSICGESDFRVLCFHHTDDIKEFEINEKDEYRWSILEPEILKCSIVCSNCHSGIHSTKSSHFDGKTVLLNYKELFECVRCGYNDVMEALVFHHTHDKKFQLAKYNYSRFLTVKELNDRISSELDKCDVLCSNCHFIEHFDMEKFNKYQYIILNKVETYKETPNQIDRELIYKLKDSGMSHTNIANQLNCAKSTITYAIKQR